MNPTSEAPPSNLPDPAPEAARSPEPSPPDGEGSGAGLYLILALFIGGCALIAMKYFGLLG